jgi:hypothetical protein
MEGVLVLPPNFGEMVLLNLSDWLCHHNLLRDVNFIVFSEDRVAQEIEGFHSIFGVEHQALSHEI